MADNEFQVEAIGGVYAQALINEAVKQDALNEVTEDVRGIGMLLATNETFAAFTQNLTIGEEERLRAIEKIFGGRVHTLTLNTMKSLAMRDRMMFFRGFVEGFDDILKKMGGYVDVEIVSARELSPEVLERVKGAIGRSLGKTPDIRVTIKPELIGGVSVRIGDTLIDGSVATQLSKMEEQLRIKGLSQLSLDRAVV